MSNKPIKYTLLYNRKDQLNSDGEALVQIEAYKDGKRAYFSTGVYLKPEHWDAGKERVIKRNDCHTLNNRMANTIQEYKELEYQHSYLDGSFGIAELKKAIDQKDTSKTFVAFALDYLKQEKQLAPASVSKMTNSLNVFKEYCKGDVKFSELNFKLIDDFRLYLIKEGIGANTQQAYFKHLRKYAKLAVPLQNRTADFQMVFMHCFCTLLPANAPRR